MSKYLIVGNSAGGIGAAEALRLVDGEGSITIVSEEPCPAYSRPLISEYLAGERTLEGMLFRPPQFYQENKIQLLLGKKACRLDVEKREVELEGGERLGWEKLLLACGGLPIVPGIKGLPLQGVFTFTTLEDAKRIDKALGTAHRAIIIGGGLIGISAAEALLKRQVKVTIVELKDWILNVFMDEESAHLEEEALRNLGVELITGHTVQEALASPEGRISGIVLDDGRKLSCDLLLLAIGVTPRLELVKGTPIKINRGIAVDSHMETSNPGVYACGDVAEAYDFVYQAPRLTPIWPNAYLGGRVAGFNMAGLKAQYPGGTAMNSLKYFGLAVSSAGMVNPEVRDGYEFLTQRGDSQYQKIVLKDNRIVGMLFLGDIRKAGVVFGLMKDRVDVSAFKDSLLSLDFSLASLPEDLRQEKLRAASAGILSLTTKKGQ